MVVDWLAFVDIFELVSRLLCVVVSVYVVFVKVSFSWFLVSIYLNERCSSQRDSDLFQRRLPV